MMVPSGPHPFELPELLEAILTHLPERDILLAQRVSRKWHDTISQSPTLQKKLFFQPIQTSPPTAQEREVTANPLLREMFPTFFNFTTLDQDGGMLLSADGVDSHSWMHDDRAPTLWDQAWFKSEHRRRAVLRPEASWRRMFPTQPAPRFGRMGVNHLGCGCGGNDTMEVRLGERYQPIQEQGARMGLIWDVVVFVLDDNPKGSFCVSWWRRGLGNSAEGEDDYTHWVLDMRVNTEHSWDCFRADKSYEPCGLKVVDCDKDIVEYDFFGGISELEVVPLSRRTWKVSRYEDSDDEDSDDEG